MKPAVASPIIEGAIIAHDVTNPMLVSDIAHAAAAAAGLVNGGLSRAEAPILCWAFVRQCTEYREETDPMRQMPRMPWRFVRDGVGDCKSQAIFIAALCAKAGCETVLRFATFRGDEEPGHVYAVVDGHVIDPLLPLGHEVDYIRSLDVPIPNPQKT